MSLSVRGRRGGVVTAPHRLASEAGLAVLEAGGNAAEAAVAMAAALAVVYPHMNGIGGDSFWLVAAPGRPPGAIRAAGPAGAAMQPEFYRARGLAAIPTRGPLAANTVAGTIDGWRLMLDLARELGGRLPLAHLLAPALHHANAGVAVTAGQVALTRRFLPELLPSPGFAGAFLREGQAPDEGALQKQPALARTLRRLAEDGLDSFYRGALAADIAADLRDVGAPVTAADLAAFRAERVPALSVSGGGDTIWNHPPPSQGIAALLILAIFDRLGVRRSDGFDHIHGLVEATKQAFLVRDRLVADPPPSAAELEEALSDFSIAPLAARIDGERALPWPAPPAGGDTVWFGVIDRAGTAVSAIQSIYFEFGSGVVLPQTGILWQNRGSSFSLAPGPRALRRGALPFHTLNPALARLRDGRTIAYGSMGGDGQPQFQAAVFTRHVRFGQPLDVAVSAPRWLLGRTWGAESTTLKLESRIDPAVANALQAAGHDVEMVEPMTALMGHAGAVVRDSGGAMEAAADPRSDGAALGF